MRGFDCLRQSSTGRFLAKGSVEARNGTGESGHAIN